MNAPHLASLGGAACAAERIEALFEAQAQATPDRTALVRGEASLTYAELDGRAQTLAERLKTLGVGPGVLVGVCLNRSFRLVTALLAVLKAGGAYLPLDPAYPAERLRYMLDDSGAGLLLTEAGTGEDLGFDGRVVQLSGADVASLVAAGPMRARRQPDLAYVIYTSGSTGRPKGVMLGHTATALIEWARETFTDGELARVAATTSICFDPSVFEIFAPLCTGGAVVLKDSGLEPFAPGEAPTMMNGVASMYAQLCRAGAIPQSVRVINIGGEPLSAALVRELYAGTRVEAVYNHYGPTEATTCATVALVPRDVQRDPPIGRPIAGAVIHLLDAAGRPVAPGELGEIHIGGAGLAIGYLDRPELTAERFVGSSLGRLYRTGDFGRWTETGDLEFVGRTDEQVKIGGFRVELAEVESALKQLPGVSAAVAAVRRQEGGRTELVAYVQAASLSPGAARAQLRGWLPTHMLPTHIHVLAAFPLTLSGKIDREALAAVTPAETPQTVASNVEEAIANVYREILGCGPVGPDDSFFALGGDSLAGVNAALRLQELMGYEIPSVLLHQAPSPRELAAALEDCRADATQHLVSLQGDGEGTPLFCVSDLFGRPFSYLSLARRLAGERRMLGLAPGPLEAAFIDRPCVADLTRALAAEVRRVQPQGPYLIAGYSAGGVLAFDLACTLERDGQDVSLVLIDSPLASRRPTFRGVLRWTARQVLDALDPSTFAVRLGRVGVFFRKLAGAVAQPEQPPEWVPPSKAALAAALMSACATYRAGRFGGRVLLVKAGLRHRVDALSDLDGRLGWAAALAGPVQVVAVEGDHHTIMRDPLVGQIAQALRTFVEDAPLARPQAA